jgi:hypothetical protein
MPDVPAGYCRIKPQSSQPAAAYIIFRAPFADDSRRQIVNRLITLGFSLNNSKWTGNLQRRH